MFPTELLPYKNTLRNVPDWPYSSDRQRGGRQRAGDSSQFSVLQKFLWIISLCYPDRLVFIQLRALSRQDVTIIIKISKHQGQGYLISSLVVLTLIHINSVKNDVFIYYLISVIFLWHLLYTTQCNIKWWNIVFFVFIFSSWMAT